MNSTMIHWNADLLEEICLEGRDGITPEQLWDRCGQRYGRPLSDKLKALLWLKVAALREVKIFQLPESREARVRLRPDDMADWMDEDFKNQDNEPYEADQTALKGRKDVTSTVRELTYPEILERWDRNLAIVGSREARWRTLAPNLSPVDYQHFSSQMHSALESIGRTRRNGELNLIRSEGSSKRDGRIPFYVRKQLLELNLIRKQIVYHSRFKDLVMNGNAMILHLERYYRSYKSLQIFQSPGVDALMDRLRITKGAMTVENAVAYMKTIDSSLTKKKFLKILKYFPELEWNVSVLYKDVSDCLIDEEKKDMVDDDRVWIVRIKEEEHANDDDDCDFVTDSHEREYCIGESILRQVYNMVRETGTEGALMTDLVKRMGLSARMTAFACRILSSNNLFYKTMVDHRRQKITKFFTQEFAGKAIEKLFGEKVTTELTETPKPVSEKKFKPKSILQMSRIDFILKILNEKKVVYFNILPKLCNINENFVNGKIDKKSILRLVNALHDDGRLKLHKVMMSEKESFLIVSTIDIDSDHDLIKSIKAEKEMNYFKDVNQSDISKDNITRLSHSEKKRENFTLPRFMKFRALHEYLFYLAYHSTVKNEESEGSITPCHNQEVLERFKKVPILNSHTRWPKGWIFFSDALANMPLSLFLQLYQMIYLIPDLAEYSKHPEKKHTLIKDLPKSIRTVLFLKKRYVTVIYGILEHLVLLGLVRFGERTMKEKEKIYIYVNTKSTVINTTSSAISHYMVEEKEYPRENFSLKTIDDVHEYWNRLQNVCINTRLGLRNKMDSLGISYKGLKNTVAPLLKLKSYLVSNSEIDAHEKDDGSIPGDGRGAGGLDSSFFSYFRKSWMPNCMTPIGKIPELRVKDIKSLLIKDTTQRKKRPAMTQSAAKLTKQHAAKVKKKTVSPKKSIMKKDALSDEIDLEIIRKSQHIRSKWSVEETKILLLLQVAISFIHPQKALYFPILYRDILRVVTKIYDKTSKACARRLFFITKTPRLVRNKQILLAEILSCASIKNRYYNSYALQKVSMGSEKIEEFENQMKIYIIELFIILYTRMTTGSVNTSSILLPPTYADLKQRFSIEIPEDQMKKDIVQNQDVEDISNIEEMNVYSLIHSVLYCSNEKAYKEENLLPVYLKHSEEVLRKSLSRMRQIGMISMRKFASQKNITTTSFNYHFSNSYYYQMCRDVPYTIFSIINNNVTRAIESGGFPSYNNIIDLQSGTVATLIELLHLKFISIELTIPAEITIINSNKNNIDDDSSEVVESKFHTSNDFYVVKACQITPVLKCSMETFNETIQSQTEQISNSPVHDAIIYPDEDSCRKHVNKFVNVMGTMPLVYNFINEGKELGVTSQDLKRHFISEIELLNVLQDLLKTKLIYRIGYQRTHWISWEYIKAWSISQTKLRSNLKRKAESFSEPGAKCSKSSDVECPTQKGDKMSDNQSFNILPRAWIRPDGSIGTRVLWRWIGSIICHLIIKSTVRLTNLQQTFNHMLPYQIRLLVEYACEFGCMEMFAVKSTPESLFSENGVEIHGVTVLDEDEDIYVKILPGALLRFSNMKAKALSETLEVQN